MQRVLLATGLLLASVFGGGCSHYRLGTGSRPAFTSLRIEPVANRTALPQAEALLQSMGSGDIQSICTCHRHLTPRLAQKHCSVHGSRRG